MQGLGAATFYALAAWLGLALLTIQSWWTAPQMMLFGLLFVSIPGIILAMFVSPTLKESPTVSEALPVVLVTLVIGVGGSTLWMIPDVRAKAISTLGETKALGIAIKDKNPKIRTAACIKYLKDNETSRTMYTALLNQPKLAHACMNAVPDYRYRTALEDRLAKEWYRRLFAVAKGTDAQEQQMCMATQTMDTFSTRKTLNQDFRMLDCALNASVESRRYCCAGNLKRQGKTNIKLLAMVLGNGQKAIAHYIPGPLVAFAFGEGEINKKLIHVQKELKLPKAPLQKGALNVACEGILTTQEGQKAEPYLSWLFSQKNASSCLSTDHTVLVKTITTNDICTHLKEDLLSSEDIPKSICEAKVKAITELKLELAKREVQDEDALSKMSDDIVSGDGYRKTNGLDFKKFIGNVENNRSNWKMGIMDSGGFEDISESDGQHMMRKMMAGYKKSGMTTDPRNLKKMERNARKQMKLMKENPEMKGLFDSVNRNGSVNEEKLKLFNEKAKANRIRAKISGKKVK